jgi:methylamine dehydrogenase heavy chain
MGKGGHVAICVSRFCALTAAGYLVSAVAGGGVAAQSPSSPKPPIAETEVSDVAKLAPTGPHRLLLGGSFQGGIRIINGDTARLEAQIQAAPMSNFVIDPNNKYFYVAETMWTRINRGTRQDLLSVYDDQLKLVTEIPLPGRLIVVPKSPTLEISADGRLAYVYNMQPASSVAVVDLVSRKTANVVELPGCGMVYPWGGSGFSALCADGTLANAVRKGTKYSVSHTPRFFDGENDPVFEESVVDRQSGKAFFISYSGLVYEAQLGETPRIDAPWSLQEAAGQPRASLESEHLAWRPGGARFAAYHKASGRLFVLMHAGTHWTHKDAGTEVWVFDTRTRKRTARFHLDEPGEVMTVTQDAEPLLFVGGPGFAPGAGLTVLDAQTGEVARKLPGVSGNLVAVAGF